MQNPWRNFTHHCTDWRSLKSIYPNYSCNPLDMLNIFMLINHVIIFFAWSLTSLNLLRLYILIKYFFCQLNSLHKIFLIIFVVITFSKYSLHLSFVFSQGTRLHNYFLLFLFNLAQNFPSKYFCFSPVTQSSINLRAYREAHWTLITLHRARRLPTLNDTITYHRLYSVHRPSQSSRAEKYNFKLISHEVWRGEQNLQNRKNIHKIVFSCLCTNEKKWNRKSERKKSRRDRGGVHAENVKL